MQSTIYLTEISNPVQLYMKTIYSRLKDSKPIFDKYGHANFTNNNCIKKLSNYLICSVYIHIHIIICILYVKLIWLYLIKV